MAVFADALAYMGGYGIKAYLIAQDLNQIVEHYTRNESIVSNCHIRVAYTPNKVETAELLSKMTGTTTVQRAAMSFSGSRTSNIMTNVQGSVEHVQRPLMTVDEIMRLPGAKKEGLGNDQKIVEPGKMLIFVAGTYPILGTQILYFLDKELRRRASLAPPTQFYIINHTTGIDSIGTLMLQPRDSARGAYAAPPSAIPATNKASNQLDESRQIADRPLTINLDDLDAEEDDKLFSQLPSAPNPAATTSGEGNTITPMIPTNANGEEVDSAAIPLDGEELGDDDSPEPVPAHAGDFGNEY
jgi:hypothetical protein